jgi:hypothetical protein
MMPDAEHPCAARKVMVEAEAGLRTASRNDTSQCQSVFNTEDTTDTTGRCRLG